MCFLYFFVYFLSFLFLWGQRSKPQLNAPVKINTLSAIPLSQIDYRCCLQGSKASRVSNIGWQQSTEQEIMDSIAITISARVYQLGWFLLQRSGSRFETGSISVNERLGLEGVSFFHVSMPERQDTPCKSVSSKWRLHICQLCSKPLTPTFERGFGTPQ